MKSLSNLVRLILALTLAAFGTSALAQTKIYSLTVPTSTVAAGQTATIVATFKNETPNGNSSFNSIQGLKVSGPLSIIGASVPNGRVQPIPIPAAGVKSISIVSMLPVKNGKTFTVELTVKADSAVGCTNSSATWTVDNVWTGSDLSGNTFARIPAGSAWPTTTVAGGACSLSFAPAPADALTNQSITSTPFSDIGPSVKVKAVNGSNQPVSGVPVRLEKSGGLCTIANTSYVTTGIDGLAAFSGVASSTAGGCTLTATTTAPGVATAAASFNVVEGVLKITGLGETVVSPVSVTVSLVNTSTQNVIPAAGIAGLVGTCATVAQTAAPLGTVTFSIAPTPGTCTIGATGQFAGVTINSVPLSSSVNVATITSSGTLACEGDQTYPFAFNGTPGASTDPEVVTFFAGVRKQFKTTCNLINFFVTNNIANYKSGTGANGTGNVYDASGVLLPPNFAVINYLGNDVLLAHTMTFLEAAGSDGKPKSDFKTKYCKPGATDCTIPANQLDAYGCLSSAIAITSIPPNRDGAEESIEPGCVRGEAWASVKKDPSGSDDEKACAALLSGSGSSAPNCVKIQVDILEAKDPPWGRTS